MNEVLEINICDVLCTWNNVISSNDTSNNEGCTQIECKSNQILLDNGLPENDKNKNSKRDKKRKLFVCSSCYKEFSSRNSLRVHLNIHSGNKNYCCEHCGKLFSHNATLIGHLTKFHHVNPDTAHICTVCDKVFCRKNALKIHMATHVGFKPFPCKICSKSFSQKITRDIHVLTHTGKYDYSCSQCSRKFPTRYKLNYHMKSHSLPEYQCLLCLKQFTNKEDLDEHCELHKISTAIESVDNNKHFTNGTKCPEDSAIFNCSKTSTINKTSNRCKLTENNKFNKTDQLNSILKKKQFLCNFCGCNFLERRSLLQHIKMRHSVVQSIRYPCYICQKTFSQKSKLNFHMKRHTEVRDKKF